MEQNSVPVQPQLKTHQARVQRRRVAVVVVLWAVTASVTLLVLRRTGRWPSASGIMFFAATFLAAEGIQLIAEWWKPSWFQPRP